jgi:hypothetical protein
VTSSGPADLPPRMAGPAPFSPFPPPVGQPASVEPPIAQIDTEFDTLIGRAFPRKRRWITVIFVAVAIALAGGTYALLRGGAPGPVKVCNQLSMPGLTTREGQQILADARHRGISETELRDRCGALVDEFSP